ncbi:hypothetical protein WJX77_010872 [Trebouxia sp. C0004]
MAASQGLLAGKLAVVTGASRGIGQAIAEAFAAESALLVLTAEAGQEAELKKAAASCKEKGAAGAEVVTADLSGPKGVDALASAAQKVGTVDVLVNNAGAYAPMSFDQGDNKGQGPLDGNPDDWDRTLYINLNAPMRLTRHFAPAMKEKGAGWILNIASIESTIPYPSAPAYATSKWGLRGWSKSCFMALQEEGVKVMTINPAQVSSPMTWSRPDSEYIPDLMIQPQEIANLCVFAFKLNENVCMEEVTVQTMKKPKKPKS